MDMHMYTRHPDTVAKDEKEKKGTVYVAVHPAILFWAPEPELEYIL